MEDTPPSFGPAHALLSLHLHLLFTFIILSQTLTTELVKVPLCTSLAPCTTSSVLSSKYSCAIRLRSLRNEDCGDLLIRPAIYSIYRVWRLEIVFLQLGGESPRYFQRNQTLPVIWSITTNSSLSTSKIVFGCFFDRLRTG